MKKFIPKEKLGKKARKQLDSEQRTTWAFSPVTKKVESKKLYNRKEKPMTVTMTTAWAFLNYPSILIDVSRPVFCLYGHISKPFQHVSNAIQPVPCKCLDPSFVTGCREGRIDGQSRI